MQNLRSLPLIHVLCSTRFWSISLEVSVWTADDSPAASPYGGDDFVHYDQIQKKKYLVLEDGSPKKAEDILSVDPLKSGVSSTDFILVPMML